MPFYRLKGYKHEQGVRVHTYGHDLLGLKDQKDLEKTRVGKNLIITAKPKKR